MDGERPARRTARCGIHGRFYDAWSATGCPECAKGSRSPGSRGRSRWTVPLLFLAGGLGLAHWHGGLPVLSNTLEAAPQQPPPRPLRRLDPTPYRAELEAIESVLYRESEVELGDAERVGAAARTLAERLHRDLERSAGSQALLRLSAFAMEVEARADVGYAAPDLAVPRREWERLRTELFERAAWLRREGPVLASVQRPPAPRADLLDVQALERFASALGPLVVEGRREMLTFGEPWVDVAEGSPAEAGLARDWQEFSKRWDARVTRACAGGPAAPALDDDLHVVMARQLLGDACHKLRVATVSPGDSPVPPRSWREASLDEAAARIDEARAHLADAMRF